MNSLRLVVQGLGHIPAIKNSMFAIVAPKNREWKRKCAAAFVVQLRSSFRIEEPGIPTLQFLHFLIASLPRDDSWKDLPEGSWHCVQVPKGEEGAEIELTPL